MHTISLNFENEIRNVKTVSFLFPFIKVYVDIGLDQGATAKLDFTFSTTVTTVSRLWDIKVTQIECSSLSRPYDSGCLQYFTGTTGRLTSFNFGQSSSSLYGHLPSQKQVISFYSIKKKNFVLKYFSYSQNICIRQEAGQCCISYNVCGDTSSYNFDNTDVTSLVGSECTVDFLEITGAAYTCSTLQLGTRFCGQVFHINKGTTTAQGPAHSLCGMI